MAQLFNRLVTLLVGRPPVVGNYVLVTPDALKIEKLRIDFSIEKDDKPKPNKCEVEIYNLNAQHREQLEAKGLRVVISAGYPGTQAQIFSGDTRYGNSEKHGPDWITKLECGDTERAFNQARISESFGPGSSISDVIGAVAKAFQIDKGNLVDKANTIVRNFSDGYVAHGLVSAELTRLLEPANLGWSMQDGRLEVLDLLETLSAADVPVISAKTGMVGSPEFGTGEKVKGQAFLKVKSLLRPDIRPGSKFEVRSQRINGFFKCRKVKHVGSTFGGNFYSELEAIHV